MTHQLKRSQRQEDRIAKRSGGSRNAGSGNGWQRKGDVRDPRFLHEAKRTDNTKQITVKLDDLELVRKHAWADSRTPVFHIEIGDKRYVILMEDDFYDLAGEG